MPKTVAQVRQRVGEDLGLVPVGQDLEAQDQNRINDAYVEAYEVLKEKGLAAWPSVGPLPDKFMASLCLFIESRLVISYSIPESRALRINQEAGPEGITALERIGAMVVQDYESHSEPADY